MCGVAHARGRPLADVVPALAGLTDLRCEDVDVGRLEKLDAVFLATTHGAARELAAVLERAPLLLDLSMDHRLEADWAYGLVEWNAERIALSRRIAVPGCFATAILLALAPFVAAGAVGGPVSVAAATGSTGTGAAPQPAAHHPERFANLRTYKILDHQHLAEMRSCLGRLGGSPQIHFVPISAPVDRGILAAAFVPSDGDGASIVERAYARAPLVRIRRESPRNPTRARDGVRGHFRHPGRRRGGRRLGDRQPRQGRRQPSGVVSQPRARAPGRPGAPEDSMHPMRQR
jgi:N-acetyl-gamma-glutamyl-phosphate reductase